MRAGWQPGAGIVLAFWDAEESGLIGSTEWGEAHGARLTNDAIAYVNADAVVGGLRFRASGTPGLLRTLRRVLERVPAPGTDDGTSLFEQWKTSRAQGAARERDLGLPGSGSDYTVFLHHLGIPVLDFAFGGAGGGQYHTSFDDFTVMDRFLDPTWEGHETAGLFVAELLAELADRGRESFDDVEAAIAMARMVRRAGAEETEWLGAERTERLAEAFEALARVAGDPVGRAPRPTLYRELLLPDGLDDRPWYRNPLWAPGLDTGYAAETLPALRRAAERGPEALALAFESLLSSVRTLEATWRSTGVGSAPTAGQ